MPAATGSRESGVRNFISFAGRAARQEATLCAPARVPRLFAARGVRKRVTVCCAGIMLASEWRKGILWLLIALGISGFEVSGVSFAFFCGGI